MISPFAEPIAGVLRFDEVFNGEKIISIIEEANTLDADDLKWDLSGTGHDGARGSYRTSVSFPLGILIDPQRKHPSRGELLVEIIDKMSLLAIAYSTRYLVETNTMEQPNILRYSAGGSYRTHTDDSPSIRRQFSMVANLSNSSTGGDLEFPLLGYRTNIPYGSALMFPANFLYQHYAHPVNDGTKYSLVGWWS